MSKLTNSLKEYILLFEDKIAAKEFTNKIEQFEIYLTSLDTPELKRKYMHRVMLHTNNSYLFHSEMWSIFKKQKD